MTHRDDFQDEDDASYAPPPTAPPRSGSNPTVVVLVVLGVVALVGLAVCGGLFAWTGMRLAAPPAQPLDIPAANRPAPPDEGSRRVYTRDEFWRLVMGKTEQEVIAELGQPNASKETPDAKVWTYRNRTMIRLGGKSDPQVTVRLEGGRVVAVDF
jgi:hypothetical protein